MPREFSRTERVSHLIQTTLSKLVQQWARDNTSSFVTVTDVEVTRDFSVAKVYVSVFDEDQAVINTVVKQLNDNVKPFRYDLAQDISLRRMPNLRFYFDSSIQTGNRIAGHLNNIDNDE